MSASIVFGIFLAVINLAVGLIAIDQGANGHFNIFAAVFVAFFAGAQWGAEK